MLNNQTFSQTLSIANTLETFGIVQPDIESKHLVNDSRQVTDGDVFCAVIGSASDGRQFIDKAISLGASLVVAQCHHQQQHGNRIKRQVTLDSGEERTVDIVQFYQLDTELYALASTYYGKPQSAMSLIGVTGTNGKTSTTQFIASLLTDCQRKAAVIGTTGAGTLDNLVPIANTTPGPTELNQIMASFAAQHIDHVAMEVSSHALEQQRITAEQLSVAVFTNLSRDHLDYHETMAAYAEAKFAIFSGQSTQVAVVNGDDEVAQQWLNNKKIKQPTIVYGVDESVCHYPRFVHASDITLSVSGIEFSVTTESSKAQVSTRLLGKFNVENLLAAIGALLALDIPLEAIAKAIPEVKPSQGRMETFSAADKALAVVDYAHSPDALENAITACRHHCNGELWVVFGCGGDRDKGKRSEMGKIAETTADHVVITNDNPRTEAPELIANDILSGCNKPEKITVILDRAQAVKSTLAHAKANDVVLLAGKGHENTIEIAGKIIEYSERALVKALYMAEDAND